MTTKVAAMILPGYAYGNDWTTAWALTQPSVIAGLGFNTITFQTSYEPSTISDVVPSATNAVPLAGITAMTSAAKTAGLKVCLKPHLTPQDGTGQTSYMPGCQTSLVSGVGTAHYTSGQPVVTSTAFNLTSANVGMRIVTPAAGHTNEIPNSGLTNYGHTTPNWTTIQSITSATQLTMTTNATASSGNAFLYILNDTAAATFFSNWTTILHNLLAAAAAGGGADSINISTENDYLTCYYESQWRTLIAGIKQAYPGIKVYVDSSLVIAQGTSYSVPGNMNCVPFLDACDYIALSCYPTVGTTTGNDSLGFMETNWATATSGLAAYSASWNNIPVLFGEIGALSIIGAAYEPYNYTRGNTGTVSSVDQATFIAAALNTLWDQPWFGGVNWWTWYFTNNNVASENAGTDYAPKPLAQAAFSDFFSRTTKARFCLNESTATRYRILS